MEDTERWIAHGRMTDPGGHADAIAALPPDVGHLGEIIQGVLVHADWAKEYGLDAFGAAARKTLPVTERLDDVLRREAPAAGRTVRDDELALLDGLAAHPERPLVGLSPDWLE
ncbi:hypothetical protein [Rhizobium binxianense]